MGKAFFKSCFIVLLSFLSLSCAFVAEANSGDIEFVLPDVKFSDNGRTSRSATISNNQLKFNVSLKNANEKYFYNEEHEAGSVVVIPNVPFGDYNLSIFSKSDLEIIEGSENISVRNGKENFVTIQLRRYPVHSDSDNPDTPDSSEDETPSEQEKPNIPDGSGGSGSDVENPETPETPDVPGEDGSDVEKPVVPENKNIYYVDGTGGDDNNLGTVDSKLKTISTAIAKINSSENFVIDVVGTVDEYSMISFDKNLNLTIRGSKDGASRVVDKGSSLYFINIGSHDKTAKTNIYFENITIEGNGQDRSLLVYSGSVHLGDGVVINGGVQVNKGAGQAVYIGGSAKVTKGLNLIEDAYITINKPLNNELLVKVSSNKDAITPMYDEVSHQIVKVVDGISMAEAVKNIKLGDSRYKINADGKIEVVGSGNVPGDSTVVQPDTSKGILCVDENLGDDSNNNGAKAFKTISAALKSEAFKNISGEATIYVSGNIIETNAIDIPKNVTIKAQNGSVAKITSSASPCVNLKNSIVASISGLEIIGTNTGTESFCINIQDSAKLTLGAGTKIKTNSTGKNAISLGSQGLISLSSHENIDVNNHIKVLNGSKIKVLSGFSQGQGSISLNFAGNSEWTRDFVSSEVPEELGAAVKKFTIINGNYTIGNDGKLNTK